MATPIDIREESGVRTLHFGSEWIQGAMRIARPWHLALDYTRERAAFPVASLKRQKYWTPVGRVDNAYGDRNIMCSCVPMSAYGSDATESVSNVATS